MEIRLHDVIRHAGGRRILDGISLSPTPGRVGVVIGPNGAGKTSLLRLIGLLDRPDGGEIVFDGIEARRLRGKALTAMRRRIGFVFQQPLILHGTVWFNLQYALRLRGLPPAPAALEAVLHQVGLGDRKGQVAERLSGGEKQRLQLARVLLADPEVFLLDEPTASLDPLSAGTIETVITELVRRGKTVLFSSHNLLQARLLGDEFFFLQQGRLLQHGTVSDIFSRPVSLDIAEFSQSHNILRGELRAKDGIAELRLPGLDLHVVSDLADGPAAAVIRPEDILLSHDPLHSSARNSLPGTVLRLQDWGMVHAVAVDCGGASLTAFITREAAEQMNLRCGDAVYLTFKSTAVHVVRV